LRRGGGIYPLSEPMFFLGLQDSENSKPVFDPDFHTELIIKEEYEDYYLGNNYNYIIIKKYL